MKFINKIITKLNDWLIFLEAFLVGLLKEYTPQKLIDFFRVYKEKILKKIQELGEKLTAIKFKFLTKKKVSSELKEKDKTEVASLEASKQSNVSQVKTSPIALFVMHFKTLLKQMITLPKVTIEILKNISKNKKAYLNALVSICKKNIYKLEQYLIYLRKNIGKIATNLSYTALFTIIISFIGYNIHKVVRLISPPVVKKIDPPIYIRPPYYQKQKKYISIGQIYLPIILNNKEKFNTIYLSLTVHSSNKNIKNYLKKHSFEISDHLTNHLETLDPSFLLTHEGKKVIKEKVASELTSFFIQKNIDGSIEEVFIDDIIVD